MDMNSINRTLYIPLYGKSFVSQKGIILNDPMAEKIWARVAFPLKTKSRSKWLAYYMGMRSAVFDNWTGEHIRANPDSVVIHLGCGLDSRCLRVDQKPRLWYDVDFPEVIEERRKHYHEDSSYRMIGIDVRDPRLWDMVSGPESAVVIMEGISMYMKPQELEALLRVISARFEHVSLLMDCYSTFAAKASKFKNPINDVGVTEVYGLDDPLAITSSSGFSFVQEWDMTPSDLVDQLQGMEKTIFKKLYAGKTARKMYHLYEYKM